jgi:hypothetical protein
MTTRWSGATGIAPLWIWRNTSTVVIWDDDVPRPAVEIFEDALRNWKSFLRDWGFEEARFIAGQPTGQT